MPRSMTLIEPSGSIGVGIVRLALVDHHELATIGREASCTGLTPTRHDVADPLAVGVEEQDLAGQRTDEVRERHGQDAAADREALRKAAIAQDDLALAPASAQRDRRCRRHRSSPRSSLITNRRWLGGIIDRRHRAADVVEAHRSTGRGIRGRCGSRPALVADRLDRVAGRPRRSAPEPGSRARARMPAQRHQLNSPPDITADVICALTISRSARSAQPGPGARS